MPAYTPRQQRFMGMLRRNAAKRKRYGVPLEVAEEFSHKPKGGYRKRKSASRK